ncbi:MAG: biotin-dependent carboxyltransferase family protein [Anaerolineales bacterium]
MNHLHIHQAALLSIQDAGRWGWQTYGVPISGAMDTFAHAAANLLCSNPPQTAALEIGVGDCRLSLHQPAVIAVCGCGYTLHIANQPMRLWASILVRAGQAITLRKTEGGNWAYLAVHGGFETPIFLDSRAANLRAPMGAIPARSLGLADVLPIGTPRHPLLPLASRYRIPGARPPYGSRATLRVIRAPQAAAFPQSAWQTLLNSEYRIHPLSDRTGTRLLGAPLAPSNTGELLSEGLARGCIQVPPDGMPIILNADCPPSGGYPKIAAVISADLPLLAQLPANSAVRFEQVTLEQAHAAYRAQARMLQE